MLSSHLPTFLLSDTFFFPLCAQPWCLHTSQLHLRPINKPEAAISLLLLTVCVDQLNGSTRTSRDRRACLVAMRHQGLNPLGGYWIKDGVFIVAWRSVRVQTEQPGSLSVNEIFIKMILCVLAPERVDCYSRTTKDVTFFTGTLHKLLIVQPIPPLHPRFVSKNVGIVQQIRFLTFKEQRFQFSVSFLFKTWPEKQLLMNVKPASSL